MDLVPAERELLNAAEQNARRALSGAREAAERILAEAYKEATQLLLQQQEAAALLLLQHAEEAKSERSKAVDQTRDLNEQSRSDALTHERWDAEQLLLVQQHTADMLLEAQREASAKLTQAVLVRAADAMMAGQREAAAFLLEARMRIEVDRAAKTRAR